MKLDSHKYYNMTGLFFHFSYQIMTMQNLMVDLAPNQKFI